MRPGLTSGRFGVKGLRSARSGPRYCGDCASSIAVRARERQILTLLAAGHQNREIAAQLGISTRSVEVHKARILEKLECRSLAELIRVELAAD